MSSKTRAIFLFLTIVAVMLVSAVGTTNVYADDGTPPPPPAETEVADQPTAEPVVTDEPAATEAPVVAEPAPTEAPVVEEPAATEAPVVAEPAAEVAAEQPAVEEAPAEDVATLLEQVPDNTVVTVLNAEGEAQPLTSQDSAEAIAASDPIWCPSTQTTPTPGANGCTPSFTSFDDLLTYVADPANAITGAGTIYVEVGNYAGPESVIDFNNYTLTNISNASLTIQGGWDTEDNSTDAADTSNFNVPIVIGSTSNPWIGSLTINNIVIDGVADQTGLTLVAQGNITLTNVTVTNSQAGADIKSDKRVRITDSNFNNNEQFGARIQAGTLADIINSNFNDNANDDTDGFGLEIDSLRAALEGVSASGNELFGADIASEGEIYIVDSVFSGNVGYSTTTECHTEWRCHQVEVCVDITVNSGNGYGLNAVSQEAVYLDGVTADGNYLFGAHLEGPVVDVVNYDYGNNSFSNNGSGDEDNGTGYGLEVVSTGDVTLIGVTANNNQLFGANVQADGDVTVVDSFFNGNRSYSQDCAWRGAQRCHYVCVTEYQGYGLQVVTEGEVFLRGVTASDNYLFGAHLEGSDVAIVGNVVDGVLSQSVFSNNGSGTSTLTGKGLEIVSTGDVTLADVATNDNQLFGTDIVAGGNVAIQDSFFNGQKHTYTVNGKSVTTGGYGLSVVAEGQIAVDGIEANNNFLFGAYLEGADPVVGVAVKDSSFSNNQSGLEIVAVGPVALGGVTANDNSLFGATINTLGDVVITTSFFNGNASYVSNCQGKTYEGYGLSVITTGSINVNTVEANENYVYGAYLEGTTITVYNSSFSNNSTGKLSDHIGSGLEINSTGTDSIVTLDGVTASNNQLFGANVTAEGLVIVQNSVFNGNMSYGSSCDKSATVGSTSGGRCTQNCTTTYYGYGLQVITTGNIELVNVTADGNYLFGAHLEGAKVDVYDSEFNSNASAGNTGKGLEVISTGDTLLSGVEASNNQLFGADVNAGGNVQVLASIFSNNKYSVSCSTKGYGLKVVTTNPASTIVLNDVEAVGNGAEGAILNGQAAITVTDSLFNNNKANGLDITAKGGTVTLTNVEAVGNKGNGVSVKGACTNTVNVVGGKFEDNGQYGVKVVDADYVPDSANPPTFDGNGAGSFFESGCVTSGGGSGTGSGGGSGSGSGGNWNGWNWWYWWWFWHYGHR